MLKKSVSIFLLLVLFLSLSLAQNASNNSGSSNAGPSVAGSTDIINKAYQCLQTQVNNKDQGSISLQEAVFGTLALGSNSKLVSVIDSKLIGGNHWQETNPLKDTAQALLAYNRIGKNTDSIRDWILSKRQSATDLTWYLEVDIDNHRSAQCTLSYSNEQQRTITINEDMTLSGNPGACLTISQGGFWLKVANSCIDNNFTISCNEDFTTSTLYQRTGSSTIFVSSVANSASALGTTRESINSKCISSLSNACDYEGTLWAAIALDKLGLSIDQYLPYLLALSESNKRFLPSSFLHILTDGQDQYSELVQLQQQNKFWQAPSTPYNRYYDSALAILSLQGTNSIEFSNSKSYFESITTPEGCWNNNNIRDTGFLLYAGWSRVVSSGSGSGGGEPQTCESAGKTCMSVFACNDLGGSALESYRCPGTKVCCSESPTIRSCSEQNGQVCSSTESCSGTTVQSSEGSCCLGTCSQLSQYDACTQAGGSCFDSCNSNEQQISDSCSDSSKVCCKVMSTTTTDSNLWVWITILIIFIVLLVVGILMRNKIKMMLFKSRGNKSSSSPQGPRGMPPRPPFPPTRGPFPPARAPPRMISQNPMRRPMPTGKDREMEETMAKLKEMSK